MRIVLKIAAAGLMLAATALPIGGTAQAAATDRGRDRANIGVSLRFGDVAFGYRDGYWDNRHRWHRWRNSREHRDYRSQYGGNYRNGYHHRYRDRGWRH